MLRSYNLTISETPENVNCRMDESRFYVSLYFIKFLMIIVNF